MKTPPIIALLTDFGTSDAYVGTMKGFMLGICPHAHFVDLTHQVPQHSVRQAAYLLLTAFRYFPVSTVFMVVVDPGVGTTRQLLAVQTGQGIYVAPDNGVLSFVLSRVAVIRAVALGPRFMVGGGSRTFHGRDIFSPAAAHLANGVPIEELGSPVDSWVTLPDPQLTITPPEIRGEVLHIDHFGNIITSIGHFNWHDHDSLHLVPEFGHDHPSVPSLNATACRVRIGEQEIEGIRPMYGAVAPGTLLALVGSVGQLEIAQNQGSAAQLLNVKPGDPVILRL